MQEADLHAIQPRSFIARTPDRRHNGPFSQNLLLETDVPTLAGRVLVGDSTYIPLAGSEWGYLAAWMDLFSRKIKGWSVADNLGDELVDNALRKAIDSNQLTPGSIIHSDRGGQYIGKSFRQTLADFRFRQSMSRPDDPYDTAFMPGRRSGVLLVTIEGRVIREWCIQIVGRCSY
ncbi:transposase [Spirosoma areae]